MVQPQVVTSESIREEDMSHFKDGSVVMIRPDKASRAIKDNPASDRSRRMVRGEWGSMFLIQNRKPYPFLPKEHVVIRPALEQYKHELMSIDYRHIKIVSLNNIGLIDLTTSVD
jgi:hypothetical protein